MAVFEKRLLSGSTQGRAIKIAATASPGTTIHSTDTSSSIIDEVWLYAYNSHTTAVTLTIQRGGTTAVDDDIIQNIPATSGLFIVLNGAILSGTGAAAQSILAYASTTNVITLSGYVNRVQSTTSARGVYKVNLSASPQGKPIKVAATASSGTLLHTTEASSSTIDDIRLFAYNSHTSSVTLTVQFGGTTAVDDDTKVTLPSQTGLNLIIPGRPLTGTGSVGNEVRAYASTTNVVTMSGYVNRYKLK